MHDVLLAMVALGVLAAALSWCLGTLEDGSRRRENGTVRPAGRPAGLALALVRRRGAHRRRPR
jgi:hypothetical protein